MLFPQQHYHHPSLPFVNQEVLQQQSVRWNRKKFLLSLVRIEDFSKGMLRTNEVRRHAVNVEQDNDLQEQITTSINGRMNNDFDSNSNIYETLGIEEGQLALGVNPEEVYKYIGT